LHQRTESTCSWSTVHAVNLMTVGRRTDACRMCTFNIRPSARRPALRRG